MFCCTICNYKTDRKFCYDRHQTGKMHLKLKEEEDQRIEERKKQEEEDEKEKIFNCKKCAKSYKTEKSYINHEEKCIGIDIMTCPKCMKTFKHQPSKSKHIKTNNCKAKSIINYNNPNNPINTNNTNITNNNITNITNNNITNNNIIIINSYGNERIDYLTINKILEIFKKTPCSSIIPNYIEAKHFNKEFPENNNIKFENNTCFKFIDNQWKITNINLLSDELIIKSSNELNNTLNKNKKDFQDYFKNEEVLEYVQKHFNYLDLSINTKLYKVIKIQIKDLIKTPLLL